MVGSFLDGDKLAFASSSVEFCGFGSREPHDIAIRVSQMAMAICEVTPPTISQGPQQAPKGRGI